MTYRNYRNKCDKQVQLYIAFVSSTTGEAALKILDEITRLRYVIARIDRMKESEASQEMKTVTIERTSLLNETDFKL